MMARTECINFFFLLFTHFYSVSILDYFLFSVKNYLATSYIFTDKFFILPYISSSTKVSVIQLIIVQLLSLLHNYIIPLSQWQPIFYIYFQSFIPLLYFFIFISKYSTYRSVTLTTRFRSQHFQYIKELILNLYKTVTKF